MQAVFFTEIESVIAQYFEGRPCRVVPFAYPFEFATLAASGSGLAIQRVQSNANFLLMSVESMVSAGSFNDITIQITDTGSQEKFFETPVPVTSNCGTVDSQAGLNTHNLAFPRLIAGNSTIQVDLAAGAAGAATTPAILLVGVHVYVYG